MGRENKPEQDTADSREEFLARWSRRKLDARHGNQGVSAGEIDAAENSGPAADEPEKVLTDADMPPIETLDGDSDYSPFLSPGVSDDLRHQAMRTLFRQPGFNITDGLNDYDEDYTQFTGIGKVITHEMKRMLQRELESDHTASVSRAAQDERETGAGLHTAGETDATEAIAAEHADTNPEQDGPDNGDVQSG